MNTEPVISSCSTVPNEMKMWRCAARRRPNPSERLSRIHIVRKSNTTDLVTEADRESEAAIIEVIHRAFPTHSILAEERRQRPQIGPSMGHRSRWHYHLPTAFRNSACRSHTAIADAPNSGSSTMRSRKSVSWPIARGRTAQRQADSRQYDRPAEFLAKAPASCTIVANGGASTCASGKRS